MSPGVRTRTLSSVRPVFDVYVVIDALAVGGSWFFMSQRISNLHTWMNGEVMPVETYPHIIEALRGVANPKDKAGFRELAESMDMASSSLGNLLNPYADRGTVKVGLEQALHIMKKKGDFSPLHLIADECGFTLIPTYSKPDKHSVHEELLDDVQEQAKLQKKCLSSVPQPERVLQLAKTISDMMQSETAIREEEGQRYVPGCGWVKTRMQQ